MRRLRTTAVAVLIGLALAGLFRRFSTLFSQAIGD
jgi:hypothetical protein